MSLSATMICILVAIPNLVLNVCAAAAPCPPVPCTFTIAATGINNGIVKEDTIGEFRIGGTYPQGLFLLENGTLTDSLNHTCLIEPNTFQLQCTQGLPETTTFTFSNNFLIQHENGSNWVACPASGPGNDGSFNIFSDAKQLSAGCVSIQLQAGAFACSALGRPSCTTNTVASTPIATASPTTGLASAIPAVAASSTSTAPPSSPTPVCPSNISSGYFQFPHLIVPTSPESPDTAFGNSYKAYISPINSTLFNFDIPATAPYTGTCSLVFLFPYADSTDPSAGKYYFSGIEQELGENGGLDFALLSGVATTSTTYNTTPSVAVDFGKTQIIPGNNYTIGTFPCQSGDAITISATSKNNTELDYFQDSAPSAIGLYLVPCA
ncbi:hypothetical protein G7Y89_g1754 [Cudoniella acicularis]|uniref:Ubiquitin 3 binding protein But2 C-terminal domain-containing protein n=1 Tax=Cudoniella acicularis TaxID=354080 RepID=A0A8H4RWF8_9HELO|nr:hypothetical protein G7Y89_g1754 [Cudoniella acicularis]